MKVGHEEFIKYKSPGCLMMEQSDPPFNELKYFGDKESIGLIFYFKEYKFSNTSSGVRSKYNIYKSILL